MWPSDGLVRIRLFKTNHHDMKELSLRDEICELAVQLLRILS
jgi:hypothetical protein